MLKFKIIQRLFRKIQYEIWTMAKLIVDRNGPVAKVTISNPTKRNAMTYEMWLSIPRVLAELDADSTVRVIAITGEGDAAFISGADISQFKELRGTADRSKDYSSAVETAILAPARCRKPVIAAIRGYCFGGGLALATGCDIRIAADNAVFRMPAALLGLGYPPAGFAAFIDTIGASNTMDIFSSARRFPAVEARDMGLVNQVHPLSEMDEAVHTYLKLVAESAPLTVAAMKFAVKQLLRDPIERDMQTADVMAKACFVSADHREGRDAFIQKRSPRFTGA
jgi:enoyl-CoA hydratase